MTYEATLAVGDCSVARALEVVGDRWTPLVLRELFMGVRRFDAMQRDLGTARNILSARLAKLVDGGIVERVPYAERPVRHEYRLTEKGIDLYPLVVGLLQWGDRWERPALPDGEPAPPPVTLEHRACGATDGVHLACTACGEPVTARSMRAHVRR